ncbi:hypothetical protein DOTSEDRAFT_37192 [Dothistroma septosporum NZE10]|uniref:Uncharacterized protein n=1 Tax=Dothistroma septosporum (strain NZE10 / CBS 128990) TaxID=675120 RepID=N1PJZ9_DOTSN|nr:hypothetical protein DOTSEDRAFT_37192 [Dothistroma septosporum NZE10]
MPQQHVRVASMNLGSIRIYTANSSGGFPSSGRLESGKRYLLLIRSGTSQKVPTGLKRQLEEELNLQLAALAASTVPLNVCPSVKTKPNEGSWSSADVSGVYRNTTRVYRRRYVVARGTRCSLTSWSPSERKQLCLRGERQGLTLGGVAMMMLECILVLCKCGYVIHNRSAHHAAQPERRRLRRINVMPRHLIVVPHRLCHRQCQVPPGVQAVETKVLQRQGTTGLRAVHRNTRRSKTAAAVQWRAKSLVLHVREKRRAAVLSSWSASGSASGKRSGVCGPKVVWLHWGEVQEDCRGTAREQLVASDLSERKKLRPKVCRKPRLYSLAVQK